MINILLNMTKFALNMMNFVLKMLNFGRISGADWPFPLTIASGVVVQFCVRALGPWGQCACVCVCLCLCLWGGRRA